ncbi:MAG: histidine--tRNA ligase [Clostridia bacterium]|nr:histidine--tRNA ligase [Clostridia bacterium]MDD4047236.1 histidine--tRNA ligase [Clostridia bacterium]
MLTTKPRGTNDILPEEVYKWQYLEDVVRKVANLYGYKEIRTPVFEHTELFRRGVGETTDIVEKEMYTFQDKSERSLTLRPEGTASTVRAFLEDKLYAKHLPVKLYYMGAMFRYDRPQAGRYRQFHQFGVEVFGAIDPSLDAEIIAMAMDIYDHLGLENLEVELNSVGCPHCRNSHREVLQEYLKEKVQDLCGTCQGRFNKNPLRILDCKNGRCRDLVADAPTIGDMLCDECNKHFQKVKEYLDEMKIPYKLNPGLVRGLDYYTKTAFEIVARGIGAQGSIGGGGRYDNLIEDCGGSSMPGIGFALGLERVLLTMEQQKVLIPRLEQMGVFIVTLGEAAQKVAASMAQKLRKDGITVEFDYMGRSLKAQLKSANRGNFPYVVILGEEEIKKGVAILRKMEESSQEEVALQDIVSLIVKEYKGGKNNE